MLIKIKQRFSSILIATLACRLGKIISFLLYGMKWRCFLYESHTFNGIYKFVVSSFFIYEH